MNKYLFIIDITPNNPIFRFIYNVFGYAFGTILDEETYRPTHIFMVKVKDSEFDN